MIQVKINAKGIREAREKAGMSRQDLCYKLRDDGVDLGLSTIQAWENETKVPGSVVTMAALCHVLGVKPWEVEEGI